MNFRDSGGWEATIFLNPNVRMDTGLRFRMEFPASKSFWMLSLKISHIWCLGKKILEARDRDTDIPEVKKKKINPNAKMDGRVRFGVEFYGPLSSGLMEIKAMAKAKNIFDLEQASPWF